VKMSTLMWAPSFPKTQREEDDHHIISSVSSTSRMTGSELLIRISHREAIRAKTVTRRCTQASAERIQPRTQAGCESLDPHAAHSSPWFQVSPGGRDMAGGLCRILPLRVLCAVLTESRMACPGSLLGDVSTQSVCMP